MNTVFTENFSEPEFNISEIVRYMGGDFSDPATRSMVDSCVAECRDFVSYKVCYSCFPISVSEGAVSFPFADFKSKGLAKNLRGCTQSVVFAATVGISFDRLITRYGSISPLKSLAFQAIGAERIEALCDAFCGFLKNKFAPEQKFTRPRFSPGYGDFSIEYQREFFKVLDCGRKIGLFLNDSMLMSPSKSVTAVVGVSENDCGIQKNKCARCANTECAFRSDLI